MIGVSCMYWSHVCISIQHGLTVSLPSTLLSHPFLFPVAISLVAFLISVALPPNTVFSPILKKNSTCLSVYAVVGSYELLNSISFLYLTWFFLLARYYSSVYRLPTSFVQLHTLRSIPYFGYWQSCCSKHRAKLPRHPLTAPLYVLCHLWPIILDLVSWKPGPRCYHHEEKIGPRGH